MGKETFAVDSNSTGSGGSYTWDVLPLRKKTATIVFKYYRGWQSATAANTIIYMISVNE